MLCDHDWKLKYTPDDGDLVSLFYVPALRDAERYDRLTGYFSASALRLAARGIEGLARNDGRMRLVVGCTLDAAEVEAIEEGEELRPLVERRLANLPLAPPDQATSDALELLSWMVARGHLDVRVAVPCDADRRPVAADGIFHEKAGVIQDGGGDRLAWNGSLNETAAGWQHNWESINVYTSWGPDARRVDEEEANFARIWAGRAQRVIVLDIPAAVRQELMRFLPKDDLPARLKEGPEAQPLLRFPLRSRRPQGLKLHPHRHRPIFAAACGRSSSAPLACPPAANASGKPPRRLSRGRTRRELSSASTATGRRACSLPTRSASARPSRPACCCGRAGWRAAPSASSSWRPRPCSGSGRSSCARSSTSTGRCTTAAG